ncbi:MAG: PSD1 and planctomycete cytochrome C domain-containing protein [Planctomycetota bacterium]
MFAIACARSASASEDSHAIVFARDIRPILASNCFKCHGPDPVARQAGLRLDTREGATQVRTQGAPAIVPGDPARSLLVSRVSSDDPSVRMPPPEVNPHGIDAGKIALLSAWIESGATWGAHWAWIPPNAMPAPKLSRSEWCRTSLDYWVMARLEEEHLEPSPPARASVLLRRVTLDLTGLPPDPAEVETFVADPSDAAYERAVNRLLASPHFGERWTRWWLDLARYADTKGYEKDDRRTIWPYRDWVIRAFNADTPLDQFSIEQLAGDLLPAPTREQLIATAFHRNTMTNDEGGTDDEEFRVAAVIDRVNTTMEIWQGLTVGCAQCHAHKFDPIAHVDYYRLLAFFNNTADADRPDDQPTLRITSPDLEREIADQAERIKGVEAQLASLGPDADPRQSSALEKSLSELRDGAAKLLARAPALPVIRELPLAERRSTHRFERGSFLSPQERVEPAAPPFLEDVVTSHAARDRLALARWLFEPGQPLTARVLANRIWEQLFGAGIVETLDDFGTQGAWPSNVELLDCLALELRDSEWSLKRFLRGIVLSATYRQSSAVSELLADRDPRNRLLARGPRFRLDAEMIRDQALAVSGLLSRKLYGPPVFPPQPDGLWTIIYSDDRWQASEGEDRYRRALYTFWRRTVPYPALTTFDAPSREYCVSRRIRTNSPLQAFVTLNDPAFVECAQSLARRLLRETGVDDEARAARAFVLALARQPDATEQELLVRFVENERARFRADPEAATAAATTPIGAAPPDADIAELAAWSMAAGVLLNCDEFLTKE